MSLPTQSLMRPRQLHDRPLLKCRLQLQYPHRLLHPLLHKLSRLTQIRLRLQGQKHQ